MMSRITRSARLLGTGVALLVGGAGTLSAQGAYTSVIPGTKVGGSSNIHVVGHLNLDSAYKTADITVEQELSRPYVYTAHRLIPSGVDIISIKDPAKPRLLWSWRVEGAELHKGAGALNPIYLKSKGRYYLTNAYQFQNGGFDTDLGATVWDVTGLPDTTKVKEVRRLNTPENPGGFHNLFTYKHSDGRVLLFSTSTGPAIVPFTQFTVPPPATVSGPVNE